MPVENRIWWDTHIANTQNFLFKNISARKSFVPNYSQTKRNKSIVFPSTAVCAVHTLSAMLIMEQTIMTDEHMHNLYQFIFVCLPI